MGGSPGTAQHTLQDPKQPRNPLPTHFPPFSPCPMGCEQGQEYHCRPSCSSVQEVCTFTFCTAENSPANSDCDTSILMAFGLQACTPHSVTQEAPLQRDTSRSRSSVSSCCLLPLVTGSPLLAPPRLFRQKSTSQFTSTSPSTFSPSPQRSSNSLIQVHVQYDNQTFVNPLFCSTPMHSQQPLPGTCQPTVPGSSQIYVNNLLRPASTGPQTPALDVSPATLKTPHGAPTRSTRSIGIGTSDTPSNSATHLV